MINLKILLILGGLAYLFVPHSPENAIKIGDFMLSHHNFLGADISFGLEHGVHQIIGAVLLYFGVTQ